MEHHHHLVCSQCRLTVASINYNYNLRQLEQQLFRETGFDIEGNILEFYGRCPECRAAASG